jgi:hypothetical protein
MRRLAQTLTIEKELKYCIEEEAGQQVGVGIRLSVYVRPQEQGGSNNCHESQLQTATFCIKERGGGTHLLTSDKWDTRTTHKGA